MKNQYFGDVNDYRKYALLRHLVRSGFERLLVSWMLTPDDSRTDGSLRRYLHDPQRYAPIDPELHFTLRTLLAEGVKPEIALLENSGIVSATFHSSIVPDTLHERIRWRRGLLEAAVGADLVFVDPDNGIEVMSKPIGRKDSRKFVAWRELTDLWSEGCSILIYQHFRREERSSFAIRMAKELASKTGASLVEGFSTPHVLFLLAAQQCHADQFTAARMRLPKAWNGHIEPLGLTTIQ